MQNNDTESTFAPNGFWSAPKPNWNDWNRTAQCLLWEAVSLACDVDPAIFRPCGLTAEVSLDGVLPSVPGNVRVLLDLAKSAVAGGMLTISPIVDSNLMQSEVDLADFTTWLNAIKFKTPDGYLWTGRALGSEAYPWPWGRHETKALRLLARAADKFWKNYDPKEIATAPKKDTVAAWLEGEGATRYMANAIASLLRPDDLRTGPRG